MIVIIMITWIRSIHRYLRTTVKISKDYSVGRASFQILIIITIEDFMQWMVAEVKYNYNENYYLLTFNDIKSLIYMNNISELSRELILDFISIFLVVSTSSLNHNLFLLISSSFWMFAWLLLFNCKLLHNLWLLIVIILLSFTYFSPDLLLRRGVGGVILSKEVCMLLRLLFHQILILVLVNFLWSFFVSLAHFLFHNLSENTVTTRWNK